VSITAIQMFKTDGSVHHGGVKNEHDTIAILNEKKVYSFIVEHRGGTQQKADAAAGSQLITIKHKKGLKNGSFDWFNTSKYNDILGDTFDAFLSNMKELRNLPKSLTTDEEFVLKIRDNFNTLCELSLDRLSQDQIIEILKRGLVDANSGYDVVINDTQSNTLYKFDAGQHPVVEYINKGYSPVLKGNGKSSRKVYFTDGTDVYDCGLRLRVTSNNGINAFLGNSKANRYSQVVMKLQQDQVKNLVDNTNATVIAY